MLQEATDFQDESEALFGLLEPLPDADFERSTLFKGWTVNQVIGHLHLWNWAADLTLRDPAAFLEFGAKVMESVASGGLRSFEDRWLEGRHGRSLLMEWREFLGPMAERFASADPKQRVRWAGPDMSVRSSITARLMETWAHGQAVYDLLGVRREDKDRIRSIVQLGVNTFGWTFRNRHLAVPQQVPQLRLTAPSGDSWVWNVENATDRIEGTATEFCQVVTQTRNVADTALEVSGEVARQWMSIAQCFAGPPVDPPAPGTRHISARGLRAV
ncbi:MAG TPA: TIGR03084 family metal-binding protein [Steroidobacteraceae bacterium]|nr:TIGR03084 family metal-binding protein [Steroidobacteraceae bacterium]